MPELDDMLQQAYGSSHSKSIKDSISVGNKDWFSDIPVMPENITIVDFSSNASDHADLRRYYTDTFDDYQRGSRKQRTKPTFNPLLLLCN